MIRKTMLVCLFLLLVVVSVQSQEVINGTVGGTALNVRSQPDRNSTSIGQLPPETAILIEARSESGDWVLVSAPELRLHGWVAIGFIRFDHPIRVMEDLPVSADEITDPQSGLTVVDTPIAPWLVVKEQIPDNFNYPEVYLDDAVWGHVRQIYARGQQLGNEPWMVMKVGESNSAGTVYLCNFEWGNYILGSETGYLQPTIDEFNTTGTFCRENASAQKGFGTVNILDPLFALPELCAPGQTPLSCEVERSRASFALIYVGLSDTTVISPDQYYANIAAIVQYLEQNGVIPILQTWPTADPLNKNNQPQLFNEEIRRVAHDNLVPMLDIRVGTASFANRGTGGDGYHLSVRDDQKTSLEVDHHVYGRPYREWKTLQILHDLTIGLGIERT